MRCIEINTLDESADNTLRLTLTWDVLKSDYKTLKYADEYRLTLTWDVLKFDEIGSLMNARND